MVHSSGESPYALQQYFNIYLDLENFVFTDTPYSQIGQACSRALMKTIFWPSIMELGRLFDVIMGLAIFIPIGLLSWFRFVSEFQTRLLFNQAFSRGLEISRIFADHN